jgi:hypothetical protein
LWCADYMCHKISTLAENYRIKSRQRHGFLVGVSVNFETMVTKLV